MNFKLNEEQIMVRNMACEFANKECLPGVIQRDEQQCFPTTQIMKLAELGLLGLTVKEEYCGAGMDTTSYVLAMEEISKVDAGIGVIMSVNNSLVCYGLELMEMNLKKESI